MLQKFIRKTREVLIIISKRLKEFSIFSESTMTWPVRWISENIHMIRNPAKSNMKVVSKYFRFVVKVTNHK